MLHALASFAGHERVLSRGQYLFHLGDPVTHMLIITAGEAQLVRRQPGGNEIVLQRAPAGSVLAEASLFANHYHCDAIAVTGVKARLIPRTAMRARFDSDPVFAAAWAKHLAGEVRLARQRAEILALKTVTERFDAWIALHGSAPERGSWKQVAMEIGTSPEVLYRELARRRAVDRGTD
ncbi:MAG: Crp/Fnr family transcriptional regulator [Rhizobiales bacterium]|nr:Crp/Fnr family transcriptional regulator [Hyphomicrobiales bacterium]MBI3674506.1 Crp/Fnr family transcriptional regulator [Hyphomicrobiales bacterium]